MKDNRKSKVVAALLAWFFGPFGAHRYYLGYKKKGVAMTIGTLCTFVSVILLGITSSMGYRTPSIIQIGLSLVAFGLSIYGLAVAIMAIVDFFRILFNKLTPADGSDWADKTALTSAAPAVNPPSQHIIDSAAAVNVICDYHTLYTREIITRDEFEAKKKELLGQ